MTTLTGRFAATFGAPLAEPVEGLSHVFPVAADVATRSVAEIAAIGLPLARARTIRAVAVAVAEGLDLSPAAEPAATMEALQALAGIGPWTAQYVALRGLGWPDAFPHADLGVVRALGLARPAAVLAHAERWRPWRGYAVLHLWHGHGATARRHDEREENRMTASHWHRCIPSALGPLRIVTEGRSLVALAFDGVAVEAQAVPAGATAVLDRVESQVREWFEGKRTSFDLPLAPSGTPFQQRVWEALLAVPYGTTASYADIARRIGQPAAVRAVGAANGRNPIAIVIPCHRVIGADGTLTGYAGGLARKQALLALEASRGFALQP